MRLTTSDGQEHELGPRLSAIVARLWANSERIEGPTKGRLEITFDFKNNSIVSAIREVEEAIEVDFCD